MNLSADVLSVLFLVATIGVGPFWFLMAILPNAMITRHTMMTPWPVVAIGLVYAALVLPNAGAILATLLNPTLSAISASLATPAGSLAVWLHVLAFDLMAGRFIWLDGISRGVGAPLRIAALTLALMFGPLGLLLHLALRPRQPREGAQAVS
ncbi:MAG: ABA4-like family protein [Candidatus Limnocylindrus sp.]